MQNPINTFFEDMERIAAEHAATFTPDNLIFDRIRARYYQLVDELDHQDYLNEHATAADVQDLPGELDDYEET